MSENPARRVPKYSELGREREIFLTPKQCRALIAAAEPAFKPMITFALLTGMRRGAILALQWRSVDFEHAVINIESATTKSGRKRVIPMCERVADILQDFWTTKKVIKPDRSDRVFSSWLGQRFTGKTIERMMNEAVERCTELPDDMREGNRNQSLTFHGLRHTAASQMVASGMSLFEVSRILGHSSTTTTERYAHFAPERATAARGALRKMGSALDAPGSIELKSGTEGKTG
ncbi:MAG: site-specific integrase [Planctomycetota bacterium]|nr:site-specific integrase [Planctomycetota bacterium]